jgi:mono/diheme cytochrome c family protein
MQAGSYQSFGSRIPVMLGAILAFVLAAQPDAGRALFLANCATCHLGHAGLVGQAPLPDLLRDPLPRGDSEAALTTWIANGTGMPGMPAFAGGLTDAEIAELVRYIRAQRQLKR